MLFPSLHPDFFASSSELSHAFYFSSRIYCISYSIYMEITNTKYLQCVKHFALSHVILTPTLLLTTINMIITSILGKNLSLRKME